jgi:hypothetical protein
LHGQNWRLILAFCGQSIDGQGFLPLIVRRNKGLVSFLSYSEIVLPVWENSSEVQMIPNPQDVEIRAYLEKSLTPGVRGLFLAFGADLSGKSCKCDGCGCRKKAPDPLHRH